MENDKKKYLKAGTWYMIGNLMIKGAVFLSLPIFTRLLSTADFGIFNVFVSYGNILSIAMGLGVAGTIRTAFFDFRDEFYNYVSSIIVLIVFFSLISGII